MISILGDTTDYDQLKDQLTRYKESLFAAKQLFAELENKASGKAFDLAAFNQLLEKYCRTYRKVGGDQY